MGKTKKLSVRYSCVTSDLIHFFFIAFICLVLLPAKTMAESKIGEIPIQEDPLKPVKNRFAYKNGYIEYKPEYTLFVYPPFHRLTEKTKYIADIYSSILLDQLQLNKIVYIKNPAPVAITYPEDNKTEDPSGSFFSESPPAPKYFDFQSKMIYVFPPNIPEPSRILGDPGLSRFFLPEDMYLVSSIEQTMENRSEVYLIHVMVFRNGNIIYKNNISTTEEDISKKLIVFSRNLSAIITGAPTGALNLASSVPRASVYINDRYMGYTPLKMEYALAGENLVVIRKDGYKVWEKKVLVVENKNNEMFAELEKIISSNSISLVSSPEKCDVFFNVEYKGQTPLTIDNVPPGIHRIHLQKEGYIDFFQTVHVQISQKEYAVKAQLAKGVAKDYYNIHRPIIGSLDYEELFQLSALTTALTGLTGLFFQVQQENMKYNLKLFMDSKGNNFTEGDYQLMEKQNREIRTYQRLQTGFYIGAGALFGLSIFLFIKYIDAQDMPISRILPKPENTTQVYLGLNPDQNGFQFALQRRL